MPLAATLIYSVIFGALADFLSKRSALSTKYQRWLFHCIGFGMPAITLAVMGYISHDLTLFITIMSLGVAFRGAQYAGHYQVPYDIAPNYSGTVYGMVNMVANCGGFITPLLTSALTGHDPKDVLGWRKIFLTVSALFVSSMAVFLLFVKFEIASFEKKEKEIVKKNKKPVGDSHLYY